MCWNEDIVVPMIWASALVLLFVTGAIAYVRSCRWQAIEKQGWPQRSDSTTDMIRALGEATPKYTYETKESPEK